MDEPQNERKESHDNLFYHLVLSLPMIIANQFTCRTVAHFLTLYI